ncbi:MAG TPA: dihydrofolate reductase family protein [Amycolatopsis sp.]|nr:dihydrofolate reductase family protein [Amycolatopsis sp.]
MSKVISHMSMSLDGFVASPQDQIDGLFDWMWAPDSADNAQVLQNAKDAAGALVGGRRLYDLANGWNGQHPLGVPVFIVTHRVPEEPPYPEAPYTFVEGVEEAVAEAKLAAGDKNVVIASPNIVAQCLAAGLLDEVHISLVPLVLGAGIRYLPETRLELELAGATPGTGVTQLVYRVRK